MKSSFICFFILLAFWVGPEAYGADAITFNPVPVQVYAQSGGVPVGMVVAWPVDGNPADAASWLECNGQSTVGYPELAAVIGAHVPDLRGRFLRGFGGNSAALGVTQGDAMRNFTGTLKNVFFSGGGSVSGAFKFTDSSYISRFDLDSSGGRDYGPASVSFGADIPSANEIRPINTAVRYLIRARP